MENRNVVIAVGNTTKAASFTVGHELPEKLPIAQCVRLAMSESFANVMQISVIADRKIEFGRPEKIFTDERISRLYGITHGTYNCMYGSTELKKPEGTPKVFVAGGAGTGILIYRELQRIGIAFTAGILYENDCDYPIAKALAADIVTEKMFEPIGKETLDKACKRIDEADYVIDTGCPIGSINSAMKELLDYAEKKNKRILTKPDIDTIKSLF